MTHDSILKTINMTEDSQLKAKKFNIQNVVILGSGVMGSQIAAHCINAGLNVKLLI